MNEGENSGMPQNQPFSSPNITPENNSTLFGPDIEPVREAITSTDVAAMAGTDSGKVAAAAAAMPENDAPAAVSSGEPVNAAPNSYSRTGLRSRRYHGAPQQQSASFEGAPEFFNQAASDIVLNYDQPRSRKKPLIIALIIVLLIGGGIAGFFIYNAIVDGATTLTAEKAKTLLTREEALAANDFDREMIRIISEEESDDVLFDEEFYTSIVTGYESYTKVANALKGFKKVEGADELGRAEKVGKIAENMQQNLPIYREIVAKYKVIYSAGTESVSKLDGLNDATTKKAAKEYIEALKKYEDFIDNTYMPSVCSQGYQGGDLEAYQTMCKSLTNERAQLKAESEMNGARMKKIAIGELDVSGAKERAIGDDLMDVMAYLGELWYYGRD